MTSVGRAPNTGACTRRRSSVTVRGKRSSIRRTAAEIAESGGESLRTDARRVRIYA